MIRIHGNLKAPSTYSFKCLPSRRREKYKFNVYYLNNNKKKEKKLTKRTRL